MRDLIIVAVFALSLPFALRNPFVGILVYFWISFMNPHTYSWQLAYNLPLAMISAIVTLLSVLMNFKHWTFPKTREIFLFFLFWLFITVTTAFSIYPQDAWTVWQTVSKIFLMTFIITLVVNTRQRLLYFVLAVIVFIGFISVKGAVFGLLTGGRHKIYGPDNSYLADNNDVGLAMVLLIPLCFFVKNTLQKRWQSHGLLGIGLASIISCLLTYSRGAIVGLAAIGFFFWFKARHKIVVLMVGLMIVGLGFGFLPPEWFDRMNTLKTYREDTTANQRTNSWVFSYRIAKAHLLGGGFACFSPEQYDLYAPDPNLSRTRMADGTYSVHTAHSIYFEVMAEHGFGGLVIYLLCIISILLSMRKLDRLSRVLPNADWISDYSRAFTVSIMGFLVCAAFVSEAFFDLFWAIFAAAVCLKSIVYSGNWIEMPQSLDTAK